MKQSRQLAYYHRNKRKIAKKRMEKRFFEKMEKKIIELERMKGKYDAIMDRLLVLREKQ